MFCPPQIFRPPAFPDPQVLVAAQSTDVPKHPGKCGEMVAEAERRGSIRHWSRYFLYGRIT